MPEHRRIHATLFAWLTALLIAVAPAAANPADGTLRFDVELDGRNIGAHALTFETHPDGTLDVAIEIDLEIAFGPFTVFAYTHRNRTSWQGGRLVAMNSETDDNGEQHWVIVRAGNDGLTVSSDQDPGTKLSAAMLPTTYWMASTVRQTRMINSQTGELLEVRTRKVGRETVPGPGGAIPATHYRLDGDLEIDLWYDDAGVLIGLAFVARGAQVTYRLRERTGEIPVSMAGSIMHDRR